MALQRSYTDPDKFVDDLERFVEGIAKGIARGFLREVRDRNPVDTGHSKANWIVTGGRAYNGVIGVRSHAAGSVDDSLPESTMRAVETQWKLAHGNIHITNNVDYVPKLNAIHPVARGYVTIAIHTAVASVKP